MIGTLPARADNEAVMQAPDYTRLLSPEYLSAIVKRPVHIMDEKAVGADFARRFQALTGTGDKASYDERNAMIPEGGRRLLEALKKADPAAGAEAEQYDGLTNFMVDSASVRPFGTVLCLPAPLDCLAYLPARDMHDAAVDRVYHIAAQKPVSHANIFKVLDVWSQLLMEGDEGRIKIQTRDPNARIIIKPLLEKAVIECAKAEHLANDFELDDYYMTQFLSDLHDDLMGHHIVSYYQYLNGDADPAQDFQDLYAKTEAFREQVRGVYKDAWEGRASIEDTRRNVAVFLDRMLADGRENDVARFMAVVVLKYYDHSTMPRSEAGLALGIYDRALGDVLKSLRPVPDRPVRPGLPMP